MSNSNKIFRYRNSHKWFKGNTHIHSTASDGGKTITEISNLYAEAKYDFIFRIKILNFYRGEPITL